MAQDMNDYLAQLMARTEQNLGEQESKEEKEVSPEIKPITLEEKSVIPEEPVVQKTTVKVPVEVKAEEEKKEPVAVPDFSNKKSTPAVKNEKMAKEVDDLFVASFADSEAKHMTRTDKRRKSGNRKAYVDKESGKKAGLFKAIFNILGFLILVALTILAVLYLLQLIAGITIIDPVKIFDSVIQWASDLFR